MLRLMLLALTVAGAAAYAAEDHIGDPLPEGAVQRLGTLRLRSGGVGDLAFLPDGRGAIALGGDVQIWDLEIGEILETHTLTRGSIRGLDVRPDGKALLIIDSQNTVREWDLEAASELHAIPTGQSSTTAVHYSPDATRVLTTGSRPPTIKQWDLATGEELVSITGDMHYFHEAIHTADGAMCFVNGGAGSNEVLAHYDLATGELVAPLLKDYYAHRRSLVLSADGERILLGSRHKATEWKIDGHELLKEFSGHHGHAVTSCAYCVEPEQLLTGSRDGSIRRWDRLAGDVLLRWVPHQGHVTHVEVSPDGKWVMSYGSGIVAVTSMADGTPRVAWERHEGPVEAVASLPEGRCVSGSTDASLRVWDIATGECLRTIGGAKLGAYAVATTPDGSRVAAGCKDGVLREYGVADGDLVRELTGHLGYVRAVTYTADGQRLLSAAGDGTVRVWALDAEEPEAVLEGHRGGVLAVAVSADGKLALSGGRDATVRLWDLEEAALLRTMEGHRGWVQAVTFAPGGKYALSGARDGRIIKWDLETGEVAAETVNGAAVNALACDAEGSTVYAAGSDGAVGVWDLVNDSKVGTLAGHQGSVTAVAAAEGERLVTASADTTLLVWELR